MKFSLSEILENANKIDSVEERIKYLHENNSNALMTILKCTFDSSLKWLIPEGPPPYKPLDSLDVEGNIFSAPVIRKMRFFFEGNGYDNLTPTKRETLYIQFLESIDKNDAKLIIDCRSGKLPYRRITKDFVKKAFPDLIDA